MSIIGVILIQYRPQPFLVVVLVAAIQGCSQACQSSTKPARQLPTLEFIPQSKETKLIWLKRIKTVNWRDWNDKIMDTLGEYYTIGYYRNGKTCSYYDEPNDNQVCIINIRDWGQCNRESYFYYHVNSPCIFLKLNRIHGWTPDVYDDPDNLPEEMPKSLKKAIGNITQPEQRNNIWISCEGETPVDKENLGPVQYNPHYQGFPAYYFPDKQNANYLSPLVAIRLLRPATGIPISIECRAWAKNIEYDQKNGLGSVIFDFLID